MVTQGCNPSYLGGGDHWEYQSSRTTQVKKKKKFVRVHLNQQPGMVAHIYHPRYIEVNERIAVQVDLGKNARPYSKHTCSKKG
jgi:hypothetical protein